MSLSARTLQPPNTDLCKGCFPAVVVQHAVQPTFQRVTRGCPYTGRILESTLVPSRQKGRTHTHMRTGLGAAMKNAA